MKTALITGSSRGIGKAIAFRLGEEGYHIIVHASSLSQELIDTEKSLQESGVHVTKLFFDVTQRDKVASACKQIQEIDVLVNNAGISRDGLFINMSQQQWDEVLKTNLYGPFYVTQFLLPKMQERQFGRIINIASIAARGAFGKTNYSAAKAGLIGLTKSLALEVGKDAVTVNAVCPGYITTKMSAAIPPKYRKKFESQIALGRSGTTTEVAHIVAFLASHESSYITGAVFDVNGGWL